MHVAFVLCLPKGPLGYLLALTICTLLWDDPFCTCMLLSAVLPNRGQILWREVVTYLLPGENTDKTASEREGSDT